MQNWCLFATFLLWGGILQCLFKYLKSKGDPNEKWSFYLIFNIFSSLSLQKILSFKLEGVGGSFEIEEIPPPLCPE